MCDARSWPFFIKDQSLTYIFYNLKKFFYRETICTCEWVGRRGRGRGRDSIPGRLHAQHRAQSGRNFMTQVSTWPEVKSWSLNRLSHPGDLKVSVIIFLRFCFERKSKCENTSWGEKGCRRRRVPLSREPDVGLDLRTLRSWPEPKSRVWHLTNWATRATL